MSFSRFNFFYRIASWLILEIWIDIGALLYFKRADSNVPYNTKTEVKLVFSDDREKAKRAKTPLATGMID